MDVCRYRLHDIIINPVVEVYYPQHSTLYFFSFCSTFACNNNDLPSYIQLPVNPGTITFSIAQSDNYTMKFVSTSVLFVAALNVNTLLTSAFTPLLSTTTSSTNNVRGSSVCIFNSTKCSCLYRDFFLPIFYSNTYISISVYIF